MDKQYSFSKPKIYAVFQFLSLFATLSFVVLFADILEGTNAGVFNDKQEHAIIDFAKILGFSYSSSLSGFFVSFFVYIGFVFQISAWGCALLITKHKNRTLFDSLFLLFFIVPILSNIITLMAQISKNPTLKEPEIDEEKVYDEIRLELNKHRVEEIKEYNDELLKEKTATIEVMKGSVTEQDKMRNSEHLFKLNRAERALSREAKKARNESLRLTRKLNSKVKENKADTEGDEK